DRYDVYCGPAKIAQRGAACPVVVDRHPDPTPSQFVEEVPRPRVLVHQQPLGDLEDQERRVDARDPQRLPDGLGETGLSQLVGRDVHADVAADTWAGGTEPGQIPHGSAQYPGTQRHYESVLLADPDEFLRRGGAPPRQGSPRR